MRRFGSLGGSQVTKTSEAGRVLRSLAVTDEFEVEEAAGAKKINNKIVQLMAKIRGYGSATIIAAVFLAVDPSSQSHYRNKKLTKHKMQPICIPCNCLRVG